MAVVPAQISLTPRDGERQGPDPRITVLRPRSAWQVSAIAEEDGPRITLSRSEAGLATPIAFSRIHVRSLMADIFQAPVSSSRITSGFGMRRHPIRGGYRRHQGIDYASPRNAPIYATGDGVVSAARWQGGYGLYVALEHGAGKQTRYGHMSRLNVSAGQRVKRGDIIGYVGSTGMATGPHLHFETRINGMAVNPAESLAR